MANWPRTGMNVELPVVYHRDVICLASSHIQMWGHDAYNGVHDGYWDAYNNMYVSSSAPNAMMLRCRCGGVVPIHISGEMASDYKVLVNEIVFRAYTHCREPLHMDGLGLMMLKEI